MDEYRLLLDGNTVGSVKMMQKGLYYEVCCECDLPTKPMYRLIGQTNLDTVDFGICVPTKGRFGIHTTIACKKLLLPVVFELKSSDAIEAAVFYPVDPDKPFLHLDKLDYCRFAIRGGVAGITQTG